VELFTIRYGINQATSISNISCIIIITDFIYAAKKIFDSSLYSFQIHALLISGKLRVFFSKESNNSIEFWDCLSCCKWPLHNTVIKETKQRNSISFLNFHTSYLRILVKKMNAMTSYIIGRYLFKFWMAKVNIP